MRQKNAQSLNFGGKCTETEGARSPGSLPRLSPFTAAPCLTHFPLQQKLLVFGATTPEGR